MRENFNHSSAKKLLSYLLLHELGHITLNKRMEALEIYKVEFEKEKGFRDDQLIKKLGVEVLENEVQADRFAFNTLKNNDVVLDSLKNFFEKQIDDILVSYKEINLNPEERVKIICTEIQI
jgi:Zn-dependent peptidase ImmA (M78 family)